MLGNLGNPSWDMDDDDDGYEGGSGGGGGGGMSQDMRLWKFRFKMPDASKNPLQKNRPVVHRILFLNDAPFQFWEHGLYNFRRNTDHFTGVCLAKNKIDKRGCPVCNKEGGDDWPSCVGTFTIIDMGQVIYGRGGVPELHHRTWVDKKGEEHEDAFPKMILAAKKGSKKTPGMLKHLLFQAERRGNSLEGTVWDVSRSGEKEAGIGESWEFVERVAPEEYIDYLEKFGADRETLDVDPITDWPAFLRGNEDLGYCNKLITFEEAERIVGIRGKDNDGAGYDERGGARGGDSRKSSGAGYQGGASSGFGDDDDIPF